MSEISISSLQDEIAILRELAVVNDRCMTVLESVASLLHNNSQNVIEYALENQLMYYCRENADERLHILEKLCKADEIKLALLSLDCFEIGFETFSSVASSPQYLQLYEVPEAIFTRLCDQCLNCGDELEISDEFTTRLESSSGHLEVLKIAEMFQETGSNPLVFENAVKNPFIRELCNSDFEVSADEFKALLLTHLRPKKQHKKI